MYEVRFRGDCDSRRRRPAPSRTELRERMPASCSRRCAPRFVPSVSAQALPEPPRQDCYAGRGMPAQDERIDALDLRPTWREQYAHFGPDFLAAIDAGIDVTQLLANLALTPTQRLEQLDAMTRFFEAVHGAAIPKNP